MTDRCEPRLNARRFLGSGAAAGAMSALAFAAVHDLVISDIWFSAMPMMIAGALCGASIGWTYAFLFATGSIRSWLGYNLIYLGVLGLLGVASVVVFEPVTTIAAVIAANAPPTELFGRAMPMTLIFLLAMTGALGFLFGRNWRHYLAILVTCTVLVALLGLNISAIGLVYVPRGSAYLIAELFGLVLVLDGVYALGVMVIERRALVAGAGHRGAAERVSGADGRGR